MDDEIDDVARSMTAAPPSAALRPAIRARITSGAPAPHAWRWSLAAAAATGIIALVLLWPDRETRVDVPVSHEAVAPHVPLDAPEPSIEQRPTPPAAVVNRVRRNEEALPDGRLASVGPLVVEPLEDLDPLGLNGMEIPTLTVEAMTVAPLSQQQ